MLVTEEKNLVHTTFEKTYSLIVTALASFSNPIEVEYTSDNNENND